MLRRSRCVLIFLQIAGATYSVQYNAVAAVECCISVSVLKMQTSLCCKRAFAANEPLLLRQRNRVESIAFDTLLTEVSRVSTINININT